MALIKCDFFSESLGMQTSINVIIPEKLRKAERKNGFPVLYLLHGLSDDQNAWINNTRIQQFVQERELIVVMPWAGKSFYTDMKTGDRVFTYITEELPEFVEQMFPVSKQREDKFVAGLSMGGYGAFKIGLALPDKYAAAASLSGALDITYLMNRNNVNLGNELPDAIYGLNEMPSQDKDDLFNMIEKHVENGVTLPEMYMICGREDFLYEDNVKFSRHLQNLKVKAKIRWEDGIHDWVFWDKYIEDVLDWLPLK